MGEGEGAMEEDGEGKLPGEVQDTEASSENVSPASPSSRPSSCPSSPQRLSPVSASAGLKMAREGISTGITTGLNHAKGGVMTAAREVGRVKDVLRGREEHQLALKTSQPEVGMLWPVMDKAGASQTEPAAYVPPGLKASMDVEVLYFNEPYRLVVLVSDELAWPESRPVNAAGVKVQTSMYANPSPTLKKKPPAEEMLEILRLVRDFEATSSVAVWPIHDPKVSEAVMAMETEELSDSSDMAEMPRWKRAVFKVLRALRITAPSAKRVAVFEQHYGAGVEFMFAWSAFFVQQLWLLVVYSVVWLVIKPRKLGSEYFWVYEVMKVGVVLWSVILAFNSLRRFGRKERRGKATVRTDFVLAEYKAEETKAERRKRFLYLVLVGIPVIVVTVILVLSTFAGVTMLVLRVIFIWGDCINMHSEGNVCRDASVKYPFLGWAAEVACDVLLALLFEVFFSLGTSLSTWIAGLLNYKYQSDMLLFKGMLELCIAALERIGFVGSLAFFFVPQWAEPVCLNIPMSNCTCDDLFLGTDNFVCFQRRLPIEMRRWLFEALMKGPFIVAPFINIIVKVLLPKAVSFLAKNCARTRKKRWCCWLAPLRTIVRFFTLIFTYDGDSVRCFTFVCRGQPFELPADDFPEREKALSVLEQFKVKPFEVEDEMMELEMSLLWVVFFMPLLPQGVIVTMIAKLVEVNTDLTKMLYVRRRPVPCDDSVMRREINSYAFCIIVAGLAWTVGLSLITYNDELHTYGAGGICIFVGMAVFMLVGSSLMTCTLNRCAARQQSMRVQSTSSSMSTEDSEAQFRSGRAEASAD